MDWVEDEMGQTMNLYISDDLNDRTQLVKFIRKLGADTARQFTHFKDLSDDQIYQKAFDGSRRNYFLELDRELVGYGFLQPKNNFTVGFGMVLGNGYQLQGYGTILLKYLLTEAKRLGYHKVWGGCYDDNEIALKLYKKLGFVLEGVFLNEYKEDYTYRHLYSLAKFFYEYKSDESETLMRKWYEVNK